MKYRILILLLSFSFLCVNQSCEIHKKENPNDNKVVEVQAQIKKIYPHLLETVVSLGDGSSGVIVSEDGYVLTAAHVVKSLLFKSDTIIVKLNDGSEVEAEHLGRSERDDYALLKIKEEKKWPFVEIGSDSKLSSSEVCVMLSHPEGKQEGRSAVLRVGFVRGHTKSGFLRASCKMMPGDSGGPLFNLKGELIGINSSCDKNMYENYYASVDSIKANWDRMTKGEEFAMTQMEWGDQSINRLMDKDTPFVLQGDYYALTNALKKNYSVSLEYVFPIYNLSDDDKVLIHATCISNEGVLVSKSSVLFENSFRCRLSDGIFEKLNVIGRCEENDLVFLALENNNMKFELPASDEVELGDFVGGFVDSQLLALGIISCPSRKVAIQKSGSFEVGMEGLTVSEVKMHLMMSREVKLKEGDKILSVNKKKMHQASDLNEFLNHTCTGQAVNVMVDRGGKEVALAFKLGPYIRMDGHPAYKLEVSGKREGFANAFTSDVPLKPVECGTPLVNLEGKVVGISIARSTRTCTYAIPIEKVLKQYELLQERNNLRL